MFFIFWRRWGILGLAFLVGGFLVSVALSYLFRPLFNSPTPTGWPLIFGLIVGFGAGALGNWLFAVLVVEPKLDRPNSEPPVATSTLYFMRLRYWSIAIVGIGAIFVIPSLYVVLTR
jgi:hypothetical protein